MRLHPNQRSSSRQARRLRTLCRRRAWNPVSVANLTSPCALRRHLQRQPGAKRDAVVADQRGAVDVGGTVGIGAGESARHLAAAEYEVEAWRFGMLVHDHLAAPLAAAEGVGAGVIEEAAAAHDDAAPQRGDAGGAALLETRHFDAERVEPVPDGPLDLGARRTPCSFRNAHGSVPSSCGYRITATSSALCNGRTVATS